jgi:hypothetical protein
VTPLWADAIERTLRALGIYAEWKHILDRNRSGFDVGAGTAIPTTITYPDHNSTLHDPDFIIHYVASEQAAGWYSRAFTPAKLEATIGPYRTSPLGLVPESGSSSKWRLIQDFLFLRNPGAAQHASVNSLIDLDDYPT